MFRQTIPALGLSIEAATENVPDDGRYHVLDAGVILRSFKSLRGATIAYRRLCATRVAANSQHVTTA
jgi:hypothetical protein